MTVRSNPWLAAALCLMIAACGKVGDAPKAETGEAVTVSEGAGGTYVVDTSRSSVNWKAAKVTNAHDGGFKQFEGTIKADGETITGVRITIQAGSIWSDNEKLTGHLKSEDFFAVDKFPTATFEADKFEPFDSAGATHRVTGNLTMHGVTHSVVFPATISVSPAQIKANADFIVDRKNWGILYTGAPDDLIRDDIRIIFDITAVPSTTAS